MTGALFVVFTFVPEDGRGENAERYGNCERDGVGLNVLADFHVWKLFFAVEGVRVWRRRKATAQKLCEPGRQNSPPGKGVKNDGAKTLRNAGCASLDARRSVAKQATLKNNFGERECSRWPGIGANPGPRRLHQVKTERRDDCKDVRSHLPLTAVNNAFRECRRRGVNALAARLQTVICRLSVIRFRWMARAVFMFCSACRSSHQPQCAMIRCQQPTTDEDESKKHSQQIGSTAIHNFKKAETPDAFKYFRFWSHPFKA